MFQHISAKSVKQKFSMKKTNTFTIIDSNLICEQLKMTIDFRIEYKKYENKQEVHLEKYTNKKLSVCSDFSG